MIFLIIIAVAVYAIIGISWSYIYYMAFEAEDKSGAFANIVLNIVFWPIIIPLIAVFENDFPNSHEKEER